MTKKKDWGEVKGRWPDIKKIKCKDCIYRDRAVIDIFNPPKDVGAAKDVCEMYPLPPDGNGKPSDILFQNADCEFYIEDIFGE